MMNKGALGPGLLIALAACRPSSGHPSSNAAGVDPGPDAGEPGEVSETDAGQGQFPTGHPDKYWLDRIGTGEERVRAVCARGRNDRISRHLCQPGVRIDSLTTLLAVLGLTTITDGLALATNSSGLGFRTVSALNPRAFFSNLTRAGVDRDEMVVAAYSRGEQLVEMVAHDKDTERLNFYLLAYRQSCDASECGSEDLLSANTETGWIGWSLYLDEELEDSPLDCLSCHRPDGPGTRSRLLMRDYQDPWFHWMPETRVQSDCAQRPPGSQRPLHLAPPLRADFERAHAATGYAGQNLGTTRVSDGHNLHSLIGFYAAASPSTDDEPFVMDSRTTIDEWRCRGTNTTWRAYRENLLEDRGLPVPYYAFDVLDRTLTQALTDYPGYLKANTARSSFAVANGLIRAEAQIATGGLVAGERTADQILRQACIRCHDARAPAGSVRERFRVQEITAESAAAALVRLALPADSPFAMPPRRAASLSEEARRKVAILLGTLTRGGPAQAPPARTLTEMGAGP